MKIDPKTLPFYLNLKKECFTSYLNKIRYGFQLDILSFLKTNYKVSNINQHFHSLWELKAKVYFSFFFTLQKNIKRFGPHFC
jgi:hypothetical protein